MTIGIKGFPKGYTPFNRVLIDEGKLVSLYVEKGLSTYKIAQIMGTCQMTIYRRLRVLGTETKRSYSPSTEQRLKISALHKGAKRSKETKQKMRLSALGRVFSPEHKEALSVAHIGNDGYWYGKHRSPETKGKIRKALLGEKHPRWRGGISNDEYSNQFNKELKELIRKRDNYTCQLCGVPECECLKKLSVHHIDYNKQNGLPSNLISLCHVCNPKVNSNQDYWTQYFTRRMKSESVL